MAWFVDARGRFVDAGCQMVPDSPAHGTDFRRRVWLAEWLHGRERRWCDFAKRHAISESGLDIRLTRIVAILRYHAGITLEKVSGIREGMMAPGKDERSLAELFAELSRETGQLVRKEVELATTEMTAKAKKAGADAAMIAAGGALLHAALLVLLAAFVIALAQLGITPWVSALIVGVLTAVVGYLLVNRGRASMRRTTLAPTQTMESLKETATWTTRQGA